MIQITQLKLPLEHGEAETRNKIIKELELRRIFKNMPDFRYRIIRKSIDARKKPEISYVYTVAVNFDRSMYDYDFAGCPVSELIFDESAQTKDIENTILKKCKSKNISKYAPVIYKPVHDVTHSCTKSPVIVGEGPAGLFAGLVLAYAGFNPVIIERGDCVEKRSDKVRNFWLTGEIDEETNVQYGEGGAGTFSDGKLNTLVKDKTGRNQYVLDTFVKFGADRSCSYDSKPHVGTDILEDVVKNIREEIIRYGGKVSHLCKMTDLSVRNDVLEAISIINDGKTERIYTDDLVLAIGHSARDTFEMLLNKGVCINQKNFALGIRIQHPQRMIDDSQYGKGHYKELPPSPYKLTNHTSNGRDVFSFCMCPGGYVVNASSKKGHLCVNGMSYSDRASENANSALIVAVDREDFGSDDPLAGVKLQEHLEKKAYELGKGKIPVQLFADFENNSESSQFGDVTPVFKGETSFANLNELFPKAITEALIESINKFGYTIEGFSSKDAVLAAVESRTSSPVRILRDDSLEANIKGIYPCGEGAGYAGGIMSAAMDGIKVAEAIILKYRN